MSNILNFRGACSQTLLAIMGARRNFRRGEGWGVASPKKGPHLSFVYAELMIAHKHVFVFSNYDRSCTFHSSTRSAHAFFAAKVGRLSYLLIALMEHTMAVNIQYYFLSLDLIPKWLTCDIG